MTEIRAFDLTELLDLETLRVSVLHSRMVGLNRLRRLKRVSLELGDTMHPVSLHGDFPDLTLVSGFTLQASLKGKFPQLTSLSSAQVSFEGEFPKLTSLTLHGAQFPTRVNLPYILFFLSYCLIDPV